MRALQLRLHMLSRVLGSLVPLTLAALTACSDDSGPPRSPANRGPSPRRATPEEGDGPNASTRATDKDVCATLDYGHERSNADFYLKFADDDAAFEYSKGFLEANAMPQGVAVSHDAHLVGLVAKVYEGMRKVFPRETEGLEDPPLVITVRDDTVNAFAGFDERAEYDKAPWMLWIHNGTLAADIPDAQLEGLFGHELAHLILRNYLPETRAKIRTHYRVVDGKEAGVIGAVTADDPAVRERTEELRTLGRLVARDYVATTLPFSAFEDATYDSLLTTLHDRQGGSADPDACRTADANVNRMRGIYQNAASVHAIKLSLSASDRTQLEALGQATADAMRKCYAHVDMSIYELKIRDATAESAEDEVDDFIELALDPASDEYDYAYPLLMANDVEKKVDAKTGTPTIDRMLEVVETLHARVKELESDSGLPIDELRVFDLEEDADDAAIRILRAIGEDPLSAAHLYVSQMENPEACYSSVKGGIVPPYGRFIDPHNATCWRWFHSNQLANALESCPKLPRQSSPTNGVAARSPADRRPMDLRRHRR